MNSRPAAGALLAGLASLTLCCVLALAAQVAVPPPSGHVTDTTGMLTVAQKASLEQTLQDFEARKGSQLAVLIVPSTAPESIEQYALRVAEQWKPGRKNVDDGALLIVARNDRTIRIEVGYGLEGALNDAVCKRIISEIIAPQFRQGNFFDGISAGLERMMRVVEGEALPPPQRRAARETDDTASYAPVLFVLALIVGAALRALFGRLGGALLTGGITAALAWVLAGALSAAVLAGVLAFLYTLLGGGLRGLAGGHHSGYRSGGFGGGLGGGGGFSGGGGGFGGGGASGKW